MCCGVFGPELDFRSSSRGTEDDRTEASHDVWGYLIALVANISILARALPIATPALLAHYAWYLPALVGLLAWSFFGGKRYLQWRLLLQAVFRLQCFLLPCHMRVWALFNDQPPSWHAGTGSELLNAGVFAAGLLGQSYVGVLALLTFAHRLPLWLHLPVQLTSLGALMVQHNADMCASALLNNNVAGGLLHGVHWWLSLLSVVAPLPVWPLPVANQAAQCRQVLAFLQVMLGFVLPSCVLASQEGQALLRKEGRTGSTRLGPSRSCCGQSSPNSAASPSITGGSTSLSLASSSSSPGGVSSIQRTTESGTLSRRGVCTSGDASQLRAPSSSGTCASCSIGGIGQFSFKKFSERLVGRHGRFVIAVASLRLATRKLPELVVLIPALAWLTICTLIN